MNIVVKNVTSLQVNVEGTEGDIKFTSDVNVDSTQTITSANGSIWDTAIGNDRQIGTFNWYGQNNVNLNIQDYSKAAAIVTALPLYISAAEEKVKTQFTSAMSL